MIVAQMQYLGEEGSCDEDLHAGGNEKLDNEKYNARWTLFCDTAETVSNGRLRLQGEQESSCESLHLHHTQCVVGRRIEF